MKDVAEGYDDIAATYDGILSESAAIRQILWDTYDRTFQPGDRVLDLGCGTGIDAVHLAERGVAVTAVDVSMGMLAELREKARRRPELPIEVLHGDLSAVAGPFDGVVSAFAAMNTVGPLSEVSPRLARVLRPGARAVLHLLGRWPAREIVARALRGSPRPLRDGWSGLRDVRLGAQSVPHRLYSVREVERGVRADFEVVSARAIDVAGWGLRAADPVRKLPGVREIGRFSLFELRRR